MFNSDETSLETGSFCMFWRIRLFRRSQNFLGMYTKTNNSVKIAANFTSRETRTVFVQKNETKTAEIRNRIIRLRIL